MVHQTMRPIKGLDRIFFVLKFKFGCSLPKFLTDQTKPFISFIEMLLTLMINIYIKSH